MASFACHQKARTALKCKFPPCPCEKCETDRETGKPAQEACGTVSNETNGKDGERNFIRFVTETIGIIALFIIVTTMFWLAVSQYMFYFGCKIYRSGRNTQLIALIVIGLLFLSIAGQFAVKKYKAKCSGNKSSPCPLAAKATTEKAAAAALANKKPCTIKATPKLLPPSEIAGYAKKKDGTVPKNVTITITDSEVKEIFRQSRMYAIPIEMKQPPALLVYLRDVIFTSF